MIECINFKRHIKGSLQGFADFYVDKWDAEIHGFSIHMKEGKRWINFPSKEIEENGEKKYYTTFKFRNKKNFEAFCDQAKKAIDDYCAKNASKESCDENGTKQETFTF